MMTMTQKPNSSIISGATSQIRHSVQQGPPPVKKYEITEFVKCILCRIKAREESLRCSKSLSITSENMEMSWRNREFLERV